MTQAYRSADEAQDTVVARLDRRVQALERAAAGAAVVIGLSTGSIVAVISASPSAVPGALVTITRPGLYRLDCIIDCETTVAAIGNAIIGSPALVGGTFVGTAGNVAIAGMSVVTRFTVGTIHFARFPAGGTAQLQVQKFAAAGTANVYNPNSLIVATRTGPV